MFDVVVFEGPEMLDDHETGLKVLLGGCCISFSNLVYI